MQETNNSNGRMNLKEFRALIESLNIDKDEFYVISSGALVLRGILPDAGDLDISVSDIGLEQLKKNFDVVPKNNDNWYIVSDKVECVCNGPKEEWTCRKPEKCNEIYVQNIIEYYEYLKGSKREKDKIRIPLVETYIERTRACNFDNKNM